MSNNNRSAHESQTSPHSQKPALLYRKNKYRRRFAVLFILLLGASLLLATSYLGRLAGSTPEPEALLQTLEAEPSVVLSANGGHLMTFRNVWQQKVDLDQISPWVIKALLATEDHRFYQHHGIDYRRTLYAMVRTASGDTQGGSTITQQLVRNLFPEQIGRSRTLERKLKEMLTALKVERVYNKQEILRAYLNTVPFLYNVVGIEMAARTYYGKPASALDVQESATLVGMLKGTSYYNPVQHPQRAQNRRNLVLSQMVRHGWLEEQEYQQLRQLPLRTNFRRPQDPPSPAPHFTAYLRSWLLNWAQKNGHDLYTGGLIIHTTLDEKLQQLATEAVTRQTELLQHVADVEWSHSSGEFLFESPSTYSYLRSRVEPFRHFWNRYPELEQAFIRETSEYRKALANGSSERNAIAQLKADKAFMTKLRSDKTRLEAGFVAIDARTAEVRAWVGSRDFSRDQYDHVAIAARQPGSTFKPFIYAAALEQGLGPNTPYQDVEMEIVAPDGEVWRPTNMAGVSGQIMGMREGLVYSKNTITAQVMMDVGVDSVVRLAQDIGINQSRLREVPSLALGTSPVTLLEMVSAYSTIARSGQYREPVLVRHITDRQGRLLAQFGETSYRALSERSALQLIDMMRDVVRQGTGTMLINRFGIQADIAGKSGTTQNNTDGWFIAMHPDLVAGAWVGFNDQRVTMRSDYWGQGGRNAILLVGDFFRQALKTGRIDAKARFPRPGRPGNDMLQAEATQAVMSPELLNPSWAAVPASRRLPRQGPGIAKPDGLVPPLDRGG